MEELEITIQETQKRFGKKAREERLQQLYTEEPFLEYINVEECLAANVFKFSNSKVGYLRKINPEVN
jgi:hypothetical protein